MKKLLKLLNSKITGYITIGILVLVLVHTCDKKNEAEYERNKAEQNIEALNDTVKNYKNKWGQAVAEKRIFIAKVEELEALNLDLKKELDETEGQVASLNKANIQLNQNITQLNELIDSLNQELDKPNITDSTIKANWKLRYNYNKDNYDIFEGRTILGYKINDRYELEASHKDTRLTNRVTSISLVWGQRIKDDKMQVFIRSPYPGFSANNVQGMMIDPNENPIIQKLIKNETSNWFTGWSIGVGVTPYYNIGTGNIDIVIGPTIGYTIFEF